MRLHSEIHGDLRTDWLRAAVLGANDGIVSTASLIAGVAASGATREAILIAGIAGLAAGAMSMAAGEYVSVKSQADSENAQLELEKWELEEKPDEELKELARIYVHRGLDPDLAKKVAKQMTAHDALGAHARDELGITDDSSARPVVAAFASAAAFALGAIVPVLVAVVVATEHAMVAVTVSSLIALAILGAAGAIAGKARPWPAVLRVTFWGALAMALTAAIGKMFGLAI